MIFRGSYGGAIERGSVIEGAKKKYIGLVFGALSIGFLFIYGKNYLKFTECLS